MGEPVLHFSSPADIDEFVEGLARFERGEITADQFRMFRLARGTYGQRQPDVNMLRIKIPQGVLSAGQLEVLATVTDEYSRGFGHVTTRQNVQLHFVQLTRAADAMRLLDTVGLTTKEACGNTVRNVTTCALAGVHGPFDVTPYGRAITRHFLRNPFCQALPRKFKIAVSCGPDDCCQGAINDVGVLGVVRDGKRGFRVRVAGGLSTSPKDAHPLEEFVTPDRLLPVIEAVVRVFDRTGNRENKSRARLKYVVRKLKYAGFRAEYEKELAAIDADGRGSIAIEVPDEIVPDAVLRLQPPPGPQSPAAGLDEFSRTNCVAQKQPGYVSLIVRLDRGDMTSAQMRGLAALSRRFSESELRVTNEQNIVLRWVRQATVPALYAELAALGLGRAGARTILDVTSCPGANTRNLAVTKSRELATAIQDRLQTLAVAQAESLDIKISGCPNSCGQHHIAALGFHGAMRRVGGQAAPEYQLHLGGGIDASGATFGRQVVKVPARRVPESVARLLALYQRDKQEGEAALAFFRRVDAKVVKEYLGDLATIDEKTARPDDFLDNGDDTPFVVAIGAGECAA